MQQYVQNLLADYADDQTLNDFKHADTFGVGLNKGIFTPAQIESFRQAGMLTGVNQTQNTGVNQVQSIVTRNGMAADGGQITEPVSQDRSVNTGVVGVGEITDEEPLKPWERDNLKPWNPVGGVDVAKNIQMSGLSEDEFNKFQAQRQELANQAFAGNISEDEFTSEFKNLTEQYGIPTTVQGTDKTYFLDPGLPGVDPYGTNIKGVFGTDKALQGLYRRHAKTEGTDLPNEFSEIAPIATALAGGYFLGPALASQLGGGIIGAGGAGGLLTGANQALWGQDIDPESIAYAALTSGGLTGLNQFLNDGVLQPGMGLDNINTQAASQATNQAINSTLALPGISHTLDAIASVPGALEGTTLLAEYLNPQYRQNETPESVTYPNETFADPTGELATDPLTEAVIEEAFDPGSVEIVEGPNGEFVFVENDPEFSPDEVTQIGVPEIESEGTRGTGEGFDEGDLNEEVFVDTTEDGDEDVVVESDLDQGEGEEVFVDVPNETEEVQVGNLDTPQRETSLVDQSGLPGMLMGGRGEGEFDPFMASVQTEFPMLQRLGITPQQYLAMLFARLQNTA